MNNSFGQEFFQILNGIDVQKLEAKPPFYLPIIQDDQVLGGLPNELKRLEAARRHFRELYILAFTRVHGFVHDHGGRILKKGVNGTFVLIFPTMNNQKTRMSCGFFDLRPHQLKEHSV